MKARGSYGERIQGWGNQDGAWPEDTQGYLGAATGASGASSRLEALPWIPQLVCKPGSMVHAGLVFTPMRSEGLRGVSSLAGGSL